MAQNLHQLDLPVENQLTLKTFEGQFDVKDLVSVVSEPLIVQSEADAGHFDPIPFIRAFELAVDHLIAVREELQEHAEAAKSSVHATEREYQMQMVQTDIDLESVVKSSNTIEFNVNEVGRTALRIGEQLAHVHTSRQRAQAAYDLVDYYNQFSLGDTSKLDTLRTEGGCEGRAQTAVILRRLNAVAKEVDLPAADATRESIDMYCEKFEQDMLRLFDKSYRKLDIKMMAHCAKTLFDFNGGASCVQAYVNQHEFFISTSRVLGMSTADGNQLWETLSDPETSPPKVEPGLTTLFDDIGSTVKREFQITQVVFPNPSSVMQIFLQRVLAQPIQQYLEHLLDKASKVSNLGHLRMLYLSHQQTSTLIDYLKTLELTSGDAGITPGRSLVAGNILDSAMQELFSSGISQYIRRESESLAKLYSALLGQFTKYHELASKTKATGLLDRVINQLSASSTASVASDSEITIHTAIRNPTAAFMKSSRFPNSSSVTVEAELGVVVEKLGEEPPTEMDGQLNIQVAEKMLKWHTEAVGRCFGFGATAKVPKQAFVLLRVLCEALGQSYIGVALDTTLRRLDTHDVKTEPSLALLATLRSVNLICTLWQQYTNLVLLPLATSNVTVRNDMDIFNNQVVNRIELAVNNVVVRISDAVIAWLGTQLAKQKKNDFNLKDDDITFARANTEPCQLCCTMLDRIREAAFENLTGKNREAFLTEIGVAFHAQLLEHFKKFPVNATGGIMLAKDLKSYQDVVAMLGLPAVTERFEFLRQLGNMFLVPSETLQSYITENSLGHIDSILLQPYLAQRTE